MVVATVFLAGCALEYSDTEKDGDFRYAVAKKKAFVSEYFWDGTEENMTIVIPKSYDEKDIVSVGGVFGRGLPMPFRINIEDFVEEDMGKGAEEIESYDVEDVDREVELDFLVLYKGELEEDNNFGDYSCYYTLNGNVTEYDITIDLQKKKNADKGITPGIKYKDAPKAADNDTENNDPVDTTDDSTAEKGIFDGADDSDLFIYNGNNNILIFFNPDGSLYQEIDLKNIVPDFFGSWLGISYKGVIDHSIIFASSRDDDQAIFLYDIDSKELLNICRTIVKYPNITVYKGALYVDDCVNNTDGTTEYMTTKIFKNMNGEWTSERPYDSILKQCDKDNAYFNYRSYGNGTYFGVGACLATCGRVAYSKDNSMFVYGENGDYIDGFTGEEGTKYMLQGMDSRYLVYTIQDSNYVQHNLYVYDMNTHSERCVYEEKKGERIYVLDYKKGMIYAAIETEPEYRHKVYDVFAFDTAESHGEQVCQVESVPGHNYMPNSLFYSFKIIGGTAVYAGETETSTGLLAAVRGKDGWEYKDMGISYHDYTYTKYAEVKSSSYIIPCPYCGDPGIERYYEYPVLKNSVNNADKINAYFSAEAAKVSEEAQNRSIDYSKDDCEYFHGDYGYDFASTFVSLVDDIKEVFGHYISINYESYDMYIGANHGQEWTYCILFDLNTGEEVEFKDIYKGSEDEFKEIVAQAAKEQYLNDSDTADRVFATDETELYRDVLSNLKLDWNSFTFYDDYLTVDFDPFFLGSYADGTISIKVSYDKLGL